MTRIHLKFQTHQCVTTWLNSIFSGVFFRAFIHLWCHPPIHSFQTAIRFDSAFQFYKLFKLPKWYFARPCLSNNIWNPNMCSRTLLFSIWCLSATLVAAQQSEYGTGFFVQNPCVSKTTCGECIQTPTCAWCMKEVRFYMHNYHVFQC